jgi:hypothetical protein
MRRLLYVSLGLLVLLGTLPAQDSNEHHHWLPEGIIETHGTNATVKAVSGLPLAQAITAVREEYGWVVDYEDPPYQSSYDLVERGDPGKRRMVARGGAFQSTYPVMPDMWSSPAVERKVLEKIVSDYNQSGMPGNFFVRQQSDGSFAIIGDSITSANGSKQPVPAILDTPVTIPAMPRNLYETLKLIGDALTLKTRTKVTALAYSANFAMQSMVSVGGTNVSVRSLLIQTAKQLPVATVWDLYYDPGTPMYFLNFGAAGRAEYNVFGQRRLVTIRKPSFAEKAH